MMTGSIIEALTDDDVFVVAVAESSNLTFSKDDDDDQPQEHDYDDYHHHDSKTMQVEHQLNHLQSLLEQAESKVSSGASSSKEDVGALPVTPPLPSTSTAFPYTNGKTTRASVITSLDILFDDPTTSPSKFNILDRTTPDNILDVLGFADETKKTKKPPRKRPSMFLFQKQHHHQVGLTKATQQAAAALDAISNEVATLTASSTAESETMGSENSVMMRDRNYHVHTNDNDNSMDDDDDDHSKETEESTTGPGDDEDFNAGSTSEGMDETSSIKGIEAHLEELGHGHSTKENDGSKPEDNEKEQPLAKTTAQEPDEKPATTETENGDGMVNQDTPVSPDSHSRAKTVTVETTTLSEGVEVKQCTESSLEESPNHHYHHHEQQQQQQQQQKQRQEEADCYGNETKAAVTVDATSSSEAVEVKQCTELSLEDPHEGEDDYEEEKDDNDNSRHTNNTVTNGSDKNSNGMDRNETGTTVPTSTTGDAEEPVSSNSSVEELQVAAAASDSIVFQSCMLLSDLRKQVEKLRADFARVQANNKRLSQANATADASFESLNQHAQQLQKKLNESQVESAKSKQALAEAKDELGMKKASYVAEVQSRLRYQKALQEITDLVQNKCSDVKLVEQVLSLVDKVDADALDIPALKPTEDTNSVTASISGADDTITVKNKSPTATKEKNQHGGFFSYLKACAWSS